MKRGQGWPMAVVVILATTVAANIWVMRIASSDPAFAIEPDYYAKAVSWDSTMARERETRALGWEIVPELRAFSARDGGDLHVALSSADGRPISGATVRVVAFAVARSKARAAETLVADGTGYRGRLPLTHAGAWELRFEITRGASRFSATRRVEAVAAGEAPTVSPSPGGS